MTKSMSKLIALTMMVMMLGCTSRTDESPTERAGGSTTQEEPQMTPPTDQGWEPLRTVTGEALETSEIEALLSRLPALEASEDDEVEFLRRAESMAPPLTGDTVEGEWPPDLSSPVAQATPDGPLKVQAFRPEGEVSPPFQVAIAFDRPVVEIGAVGDQAIPDISLTPEVEGRWRWLGTQTLIFEPTRRWPNATEFDIELAAGLEAIDAETLPEALRFAFATPAPEVQAIRPTSGPHAADQAVAVIFNQPIDERTAASISVQAAGDEVSMTLLSGEARDEVAKSLNLMHVVEEERAIFLAPNQDYPDSASVVVSVDGPILSQEGPVVGRRPYSSSFQVRGDFSVIGVRCGWGRECRPGQPFYPQFTNPIDPDQEVEVEVEPAVEGLNVVIQNTQLMITGDFRARTRYTLTLPADLQDIFGQTVRGELTHTQLIDAHAPFVAGPNLPMVVRPSAMSATLPITVAELSSLRVRVFDVAIEDWDRFQNYQTRRSDTLWKQPVYEEELSFTPAERQERRDIDVDLSDAFDAGGLGHAMVVIDQPEPWHRHNNNMRWIYWVQRTDLAADLTTDQRDINVKVTTLSEGNAADRVELWMGDKVMTSTDSRNGQANFSVPNSAREGGHPIVARRGSDTLLIPVNGQLSWFRPGNQWSRRSLHNNLLWYVLDDREMYKPGETVRVRGWLRTLEDSPRSTPVGVAGQEVSYKVREPRNNEIAEGTATIDRFGGFELEFDIPEGANLGNGNISFQTEVQGIRNNNYYHSFQIQEFRRPEYEVSLSTDEGPHRVGEETYWDGEASYFAGGALVGAQTQWRFSESSGSYRPAGWQGWSFGAWTPWWMSSHRGGFERHRMGMPGGGGGSNFEVLPQEFQSGVSATTDATGRTGLSTRFETPERGLPRNVTATISVTDVNRQTWEATESVLVHPGATYVGLKAEKTFISRDESWSVEAVAVDIDGAVVEDQEITVEITRQNYGQDPEVVDECAVSSETEAVSCTFEDLLPGSYKAIARVTDAQGRVSESELSFWVAGQDRSGAETAEEGKLLLIPESDEFAVGDRARLFVQAPYYPLEAVVELRRDGRFSRRQVTITEEDPVVEIDIEEAMIPNVHVSVQAIGAGDSYEADAFASGTIELKIDRIPKGLDVRITPEAEAIIPGQTINVDVEVLGADGEPAEDAQVLLFAVDEAVLSLSNYILADPLSTFYPERSPGMQDIRSRAWLLLEAEEEVPEEQTVGTQQDADQSMVRSRAARPSPSGAPMEMAESMAMDMEGAGRGGGGQKAAEPINLREVFDALAFFRSDLVTDAEGKVSVTAKMPESLTRYRIMAVAIQGDEHFGSGETDITSRMPLMVRPSEPRFLNIDDQFEFSVVVQNQTTQPMQVDLALRATSNLEWLETPGRRVQVPAADRVEIRWRARATSAGDARVQVVGASGQNGDAEMATFPILTPATTEAFATYGSLFDEDTVLQALRVPTDAYSQFGGMDVQTSSTQLQALTDAFIYLTNYSFACTEQLSSRILSVLAVYDVLAAFEAPDLATPEELRANVNGWIDQLAQSQRNDGGFGFWSGSRESWPFLTAHAYLALVKAQQADYEVPSRVLQQAERYLSNMQAHVSQYHERSAGTVEAYGLYVRHQKTPIANREVDDLITRRGMENLSMEALGWLLPLAENTQWEERILQRIMNQVQETAATAEFQETYPSGSHQILHTTRRTDGVVLDGLMQVDPQHPLVEKIVHGLMAHRSRGRWSNTQENVFIMMALRRYFDEYESVEPDFVARTWLGEQQLSEHEFRGRTTERHSTHVPMSYLHEGEDVQPVVLQRDGEGRMYYRVGVRYAPKSRHLPSLDQGFSVARTYEAVDNDEDVRRDDDGNWVVTAGSRVRVELTMTIPARRYHVALVDWLPAGFEAINTALAVSSVESGLTGGSSDRRNHWGWWGWPWFEHQNMRDERVEAFSSLVSQGVYTYSYIARATTVGEFIAMPAKAEEMYHPETFGRSSTEVVYVVDE